MIDTTRNKQNTSHVSVATLNCSSMLKLSQCTNGISEDVAAILPAAWRKSTKKKYDSSIKKYINFCNQRQANPCQADETTLIEFLTQEFKKGKKSTTICSIITPINKTNTPINKSNKNS